MELAGNLLVRKMQKAISNQIEFAHMPVLIAAFETAITKGIGQILNVPIACLAEASELKSGDDIAENFNKYCVNAKIGFDNCNANGLISIDMALADGFVEILTGGDSVPSTKKRARACTATDERLARRILREVLSVIETEPIGLAEHPSIGRARIADGVTGKSQLEAALPSPNYLVIDLSIDMGVHGRSGHLGLCLPLELLTWIEAAMAECATGQLDTNDQEWSEHLIGIVNSQEVELNCVLLRTRFSLLQISEFRPGDILPMGRATIDDISLEFMNNLNEATQISRGDLGSYLSQKAFRFGKMPRFSKTDDPTIDRNAQLISDVPFDDQL